MKKKKINELTELYMNDLQKAIRIWCKPGEVYELRALPRGENKVVNSGYYDDLGKLTSDASCLSNVDTVKAVYLTLNPVNPDFLAKANNRTSSAKNATGDRDIVRRQLLLVDIDPIKDPALKTVSATDAEHAHAIAKTQEIREVLTGLGWPVPLLADSGNGGHLLYRIDLPNDQQSEDLVKRVLASLKAQFAEVDGQVYNASRICKLYGTMTRKGDDIPSRPWRKSCILDCPDDLQIVTAEMLQGLCAQATPTASVTVSVPAIQPELNRLIRPTDNRPGTHTVESVEKLMEEKGLSFKKPKPWRDGLLWELKQCPNRDRHSTGDGGAAVTLVDGIVGFKCQHDSCSGENASTIFEAVNRTQSQQTWDEDDVTKATGTIDPMTMTPTKNNKPTTTQRLVEIGRRLDLWKSTDGDCWVTVAVAGHHENWEVTSGEFREYLNSQYWNAVGDAPNDKAQKAAIEVLRHQAKQGPTHEVYLRYARVDDRIYVDLGLSDWSVVEISPTGWGIIKQSPVKFRRTKNMAAMPMPVSGSVDLLRQMVNVQADVFTLVLGSILDAMKGKPPYFLTAVHGPQGSAKSTLSLFIRRLVDPLELAELSSLPRNEKSLGVDGRSEYLLAYNNVSSLPSWLSDGLCRATEGGGLKDRSLYTNADQYIIDFACPVVMNGIPDFAEANDLLDRSLIIRLEPIPDDQRREMREVEAAFAAIHPQVLGGLFDMLATGLARLPTTKLDRLPRMADSVRWVVACMGGDFLTHYGDNRQEAAEIGYEASPICDLLKRVVDDAKGDWKGTTTQLFDLVKFHGLDRIRNQKFPQTPKQFSSQLRRDIPALASEGIEFTSGKSDSVRWVRLSRSKPTKPIEPTGPESTTAEMPEVPQVPTAVPQVPEVMPEVPAVPQESTQVFEVPEVSTAVPQVPTAVPEVMPEVPIPEDEFFREIDAIESEFDPLPPTPMPVPPPSIGRPAILDSPNLAQKFPRVWLDWHSTTPGSHPGTPVALDSPEAPGSDLRGIPGPLLVQ